MSIIRGLVSGGGGNMSPPQFDVGGGHNMIYLCPPTFCHLRMKMYKRPL